MDLPNLGTGRRRRLVVLLVTLAFAVGAIAANAAGAETALVALRSLVFVGFAVWAGLFVRDLIRG